MHNATAPLLASEDEAAKAYVRGVFDARVFNYGDYNVLFAQGIGEDENARFAVGYRQNPLELILCPLASASEIFIPHTDVVEAVFDPALLAAGIRTTNGRSVEFSMEPAPLVSVGERELALEQSFDVIDFAEFMHHFST